MAAVPDEKKAVAQKKRRASKVTEAYSAYLQKDMDVLRFVSFTYELAKRADHVVATASKALASVEGDEQKRREYEETAQEIGKRGGQAERTYRKFQPLVADLVFCRVVDNFLSYISEILTLMHKTRHELLRSNEKVSF